MAIILWLLPHRDEVVTTIGLVVLAGLLVYPALDRPYFRNSTSGLVKFSRRCLGIFFIVLVLFLFGFFAWPPPGLGELGIAERKSFTRQLKTQSEPILIHIMCPPIDERDCTVATQFVTLFRQAGWKVKGNLVDRVFNGAPREGLYFVLHSTVDPDPANPEGKTGAWTLMPRAYFTVRDAFRPLMKTDLVVGASYPENELGIYFGVGTAKP